MFLVAILQAYREQPTMLDDGPHIRSLTFRGADRTYGWFSITCIADSMTMWFFGRQNGRMIVSALRMTVPVEYQMQNVMDSLRNVNWRISCTEIDMTVLVRAMRRRRDVVRRRREAVTIRHEALTRRLEAVSRRLEAVRRRRARRAAEARHIARLNRRLAALQLLY